MKKTLIAIFANLVALQSTLAADQNVL